VGLRHCCDDLAKFFTSYNCFVATGQFEFGFLKRIVVFSTQQAAAFAKCSAPHGIAVLQVKSRWSRSRAKVRRKHAGADKHDSIVIPEARCGNTSNTKR